MAGYPSFSIGPIVASGEYNGGNTTGPVRLSVNLTGPVPTSTEYHYRGLMIAVASSEPTSTAPTGFTIPENGARRNVYIDTPERGYYSTGNWPSFEPLQLSYSDGVLLGHSYITSGSTTHMFRGAWTYIAFEDLDVGEQLDVTYYTGDSSVDWFKFNIHTCDYPPPILYGGKFALSSGSGTTFSLAPNIWGSNVVYEYLVGTTVTTTDTNMTISTTLPQAWSDTYNGLLTRSGVFRSIYAGHQMAPGSSSNTLTVTKSSSTFASWMINTWFDQSGYFGRAYEPKYIISMHY